MLTTQTQTISKPKHDIKQELAQQINVNTAILTTIAEENKHLKRQATLEIEQAQLSNNIIITGIQEGSFEPYHTTKLWVQEMIMTTINSYHADKDLETAKQIEITCGSRVGNFDTTKLDPFL